MPIRFNFELKWGETAKNAPKQTPPPPAPNQNPPPPVPKQNPPPPQKVPAGAHKERSCSCSGSDSSSSSSSTSEKSKTQLLEDAAQKALLAKKVDASRFTAQDTRYKANKDQLTVSFTKYGEPESILDTIKSKAPIEESKKAPVDDYDEEKTRIAEDAERTEREKTQYLDFNPAPIDKTNKVIFVRTGERMDAVFPSWTKTANCYGQYRRHNANQPASLPIRRHGIFGFKKDSPLTCYGEKVSHLIASSLKRARYRPVAVYAAPALRCVETASYIVNLLRAPKIRIEHGLDQNISDILKERPVYMTFQELVEGGYPVDDTYQSIMKPFTEEVVLDEAQVNVRIKNTMGRIMGNHEKGIILIVTHAVVIIQGVKYLTNSTKPDNIDETAAAKLLPLSSVLVMTVLDGVFNMDEKYQVLPFTNCHLNTAPKIAQLKKLI